MMLRLSFRHDESKGASHGEEIRKDKEQGERQPFAREKGGNGEEGGTGEEGCAREEGGIGKESGTSEEGGTGEEGGIGKESGTSEEGGTGEEDRAREAFQADASGCK